MKVDAGMAQQPPLHRWRAVGRQIIEDDVEVERRLDRRFDLAQKGDEILRPMLGLAAGDHLASRDIERGEQIQGPVPDVVVGSSLGLTEVHRQDRLRPLQRLDLRLLIDREDHRIRRRRHVQPHDVADLLDELRIRRELETLAAMRLQPERPPDAADHRVTDACGLGHGPGAPVRLAGRRRLKRLHDDGLDLLIGDCAWRADSRFVIQALEPARDELAAPLRHRGLRRPQAARHGRIRVVETRQNNPCAKRHRAIHAGALRQLHEGCALVVGEHHFGSGASNFWHAPVRSQVRNFS